MYYLRGSFHRGGEISLCHWSQLSSESILTLSSEAYSTACDALQLERGEKNAFFININ